MKTEDEIRERISELCGYVNEQQAHELYHKNTMMQRLTNEAIGEVMGIRWVLGIEDPIDANNREDAPQ